MTDIRLCKVLRVGGAHPLDGKETKRDFVVVMDVREVAAELVSKLELAEFRSDMQSRRSTIKGTRFHDLRSGSSFAGPLPRFCED